ncbi:MAG: TetR/AcrR family transcriptional regulator [bacterium]
MRPVRAEIPEASREIVSGFQHFQEEEAPSWAEICRAFFRQNRERVRIKKEAVAVRNLQRVLPAALALSKSKGFHAMTLRDLGRATGLSTGVLYSCFASKKDLRGILLEQGVAFIVRYLREKIRGADTPVERLRSAIRYHIYLSEIFSSWFYFLYMDARNLAKSERRRAMRNEMATERVFLEILSEGQVRGEFAPGDARLLAAAIKALLQDWYLKRWKYRRLGVTADRYADLVVQIALAAVGAGSPLNLTLQVGKSPGHG